MAAGYHNLKVFSPRRCHTCAEHRALDFHVDFVKRTHDSLDVVFVDFGEEVLDRLLGLRTGRVGADRRGVSCRSARRARRVQGLVQQQELDVSAGDEARDVVIEELVDGLEVAAIEGISSRSGRG